MEEQGPQLNNITLLGFYGSDITHAQSAWTSTDRTITEEKAKRLPKLLKQLATEGHHTPFEKSAIHFMIQCDIATHIQILKHRVGVSVNAESARYKELQEDNFYVPTDWENIEDNTSPLNYWHNRLKNFTEDSNKNYHECLAELTPILGRKRAKETARYFRPYNTQLVMDVMFNFRSFMHFISLRNDIHSQREIKHLSAEMLRLVREIPGNPFRHSLEAFNLS